MATSYYTVLHLDTRYYTVLPLDTRYYPVPHLDTRYYLVLHDVPGTTYTHDVSYYNSTM